MRTLPATRTLPARAPTLALGALAFLAGAACEGPRTYIENSGQHRCFVDGRLETRPALPYRYYGTSRVDALPRDLPSGLPDWELQPVSVPIPQPAPASPWLFPLDFFLEALDRGLHGEPRFVATVELPATPNDLRVEDDVRPTGSENVRVRADAARIAR
ncbi:MAG: hypothetical protein NXI31_11310 [bacterium]|nr:hypothetical protein [bacterium]